MPSRRRYEEKCEPHNIDTEAEEQTTRRLGFEGGNEKRRSASIGRNDIVAPQIFNVVTVEGIVAGVGECSCTSKFPIRTSA